MPRLIAITVLVLVAGLVVLALRSRQPAAEVALEPPPTAAAAPATPQGGDADAAPSPDAATADDVLDDVPMPTSMPDMPDADGATEVQLAAAEALPDEGLHPELTDIDGWLQSDVSTLEELRGRVVVVQFWTFGCVNCKNTLPNLRALYAETSRDDVEFVGIHAPEFDYEADVANIEAAAVELGVTWPIVLDTDKRNFHAWQEGRTAYWPRTYVLDRDGHIRFDHIGEGRYDALNEAVRTLVAAG